MVDQRNDLHGRDWSASQLRTEMLLFLLAVQFLTRLPVPRDLPSSDDLMIRATKYQPAVGIVVGALGAVALWLAAQVMPGPVAVLLSMAVTLLATGAFHENGLADAADALGGGDSREAVLDILRDARLGTYGAVSLGMVLALKAACLMLLPLWAAMAALVAGHGLSRMGIVQVVAISHYARHEGEKYVPPGVTVDGYRVALVTALTLAAAMLPVLGLWAMVSGVAVSFLAMAGFAQVFLRRLGGYTGECLGGCQQFAELGLYLGVLLWF